MSKYIFKLIGNVDNVLLVIQSGEYSFEAFIKPSVFSDLTYINNETLLPFIGKVIDKYSDEQMKLDYIIEPINSGSIKMIITVNDGKIKNYSIILKSKEIHDNDERELIKKVFEEKILDTKKYTDEKNINLEKVINSNINTLNRKIDSKYDVLDKKFNSEMVHSSYHKWKTRTIKLIKTVNKKILRTNFYENSIDTTNLICKEMERLIILYPKYQEFIRTLIYDSNIAYRLTTIKEFINRLSVSELLELFINNHKQIEILFLDVHYDPILQKYTIYFKFIFDDSGPDFNYKVVKDLSSVCNGETPLKIIFNPYIYGLPKTNKEYYFVVELRQSEFMTPRYDTDSDKFSINSDFMKAGYIFREKP